MTDQERIAQLEARLAAAEKWQVEAERVLENHRQALLKTLKALQLLRAAFERRAAGGPELPLSGEN